MAGLLPGCNHSVADRELHGRWIARGGVSLEFSNGRFTHTMPGDVRSGTYVTSGRYITFNVRGESSETLRFNVAFPRLTIGDIEYFHDSPGTPDFIEGLWIGLPIEGSTIVMRPMKFTRAERQRGTNWVWEGDYIGFNTRGMYTIDARNVPGAGGLTLRTTHFYGGAVASFIMFRMPVHLTRLFDDEALAPPPWTSPDDWWFTIDETRRLFVDAANRTESLADERMIMNIKAMFFGTAGATDFYDFTVERNVEIRDIWGSEEDGPRDKLTIRHGAATLMAFFRLPDYYFATGYTIINPQFILDISQRRHYDLGRRLEDLPDSPVFPNPVLGNLGGRYQWQWEL